MTGARLVAVEELSELRPAQPAAQGTLRNRGLTPLTRATTAHRQEQEPLRRYQAAVTAAPSRSARLRDNSTRLRARSTNASNAH
jgi:hypothetical protein